VDPHPDYTDVTFPRDFALVSYRLSSLAPEHVDEDFEAVMATAPLLTGLFGDWPSGLTLESNLIDLAWHEREFTARRSFSWIVRDKRVRMPGAFTFSRRWALGVRQRLRCGCVMCRTA